MKNLKITALILLSIHLFAIHARLLFHLTPDSQISETIFSFLQLNEITILSMTFAAAYSLMTVIILYINSNLKFILVYGCIDAIAVFFYYKEHIKKEFFIFGAIYYAVYTFIIIYSLGILKISPIKKNATQKEIAKHFNISESKVSRIVKKFKK